MKGDDISANGTLGGYAMETPHFIVTVLLHYIGANIMKVSYYRIYRALFPVPFHPFVSSPGSMSL